MIKEIPVSYRAISYFTTSTENVDPWLAHMH